MRGQHFLHTKSMGILSNAQVQITPRPWSHLAEFRTHPSSYLIYVVVPFKYGKDPTENSEANAWTTFSPYKVYGDFFKHSRADNSAARGRIWLNFEKNWDLMYVVVPCKYGKDPIENSGDNAWTPFSHYKSIGIFSNAQEQITPQPEVGSGWISNLSELLCKLLFLASMEKIQLKIAEIMRGQHFLHTKSMGVVWCHSNQSSDSICFKT